MLHWIYLISYLTLCLLFSIMFLNKSFLSLILICELIIVYLFFLYLLIAVYFNIYYAASFGFVLLVFAGLEVALNVLIYLL